MSVLIFIVVVVLLRPVLVLFHELGHALVPLIYGEEEVEIHIGKSKQGEQGYSVRIGKLVICYSGLLGFVSTGYCSHAYLPIELRAVCIAAGPVFSLILAFLLFKVTAYQDFPTAVRFGTGVSMCFAFFDFAYNLIPRTTSGINTMGAPSYLDGTQLRFLWMDRVAITGIDRVHAMYIGGDAETAERKLLELARRKITFNYTRDTLMWVATEINNKLAIALIYENGHEYFVQFRAHRYSYAAAVHALGHPDLSKNLYTELSTDPEDGTRAFRELGHVLLGELNYKCARQCYEEVLKREPEDLMSHQALGYVEYMEGNTASGLAKLREVLYLEPNHPFANRYLSRALMMEGQYKEALLHLKRARNVRPDLFDINNKIQKLEELIAAT